MPSHRSTVFVLLAALLCALPGCAVKQGPGSGGSSGVSGLVVESIPAEAEGLAAEDLTPEQIRGWEALRAARFLRAREIFSLALEQPGLMDDAVRAVSWSGLGFAGLGLSEYREAGKAFDSALESRAAYGPALLGQAVRLRLLGRPDESVALYQDLSTAHPQSAMIRLETEAARLEAVQLLVRRGRDAESKDPAAAAEFYRQATVINPALSQIHGLLSAALEQCGRYTEALEALEEALALSEGEDARSFRERLAWLELEHGRPERAITLFQALIETGAGDQSAYVDGLARAEEEFRVQSIPGHYGELLAGRIPLDRGGLAAIITLECGWDGAAAGQAGGSRPLVIRDAGEHWARPYLRAVVERGVMDLYQDHTFRPASLVSRGDLAFAACRLLEHCGGAGAGGEEAVAISDLSRDHRHYRCICRLVNLGLLKRFADNTVRINDPASGAEALELVSTMWRRYDTAEPYGKSHPQVKELSP